MAVIDFRVRPPYGHFKKEFFYDPNTLLRFAKQTNMPTTKSAQEASMELFMEDMDKAGIEIGVVWPRTSFGIFGSKGQNTDVNDEMVEFLEKYPDRFRAAAAVDIFDIGRTEEIIDKYVVEGPLSAIIMEPGMAAEWRFDDSRLYPIYEYCQRKDVPVFHTTGMSWTHLSDSVPFAVDNVAVDFPDLKIVISHAVWPWTTQALWTVMTKANVYLLPDMYMFHHPGWQDYATGITNPLINEHMLYGSAYPFGGLVEAVEYTNANIHFDDPSLKENYMYNNAKKILKL